MASPETIFQEALSLEPAQRAQLIDKLLHSLDEPDAALEARWKAEVEDRLEAYERGELQTIPLDEVLAKYR